MHTDKVLQMFPLVSEKKDIRINIHQKKKRNGIRKKETPSNLLYYPQSYCVAKSTTQLKSIEYLELEQTEMYRFPPPGLVPLKTWFQC